jgi:curved DNA-binding protein CbpA
LTRNDTGFRSDEDLYSLINVPSDASFDQIGKQFRKLSRDIHPDKFKSDESQATF